MALGSNINTKKTASGMGGQGSLANQTSNVQSTGQNQANANKRAKLA